MNRFRDPSKWTWWLMGGATVAVVAIWYLVDQKFQTPGVSAAKQTELPQEFQPNGLPNIQNDPLSPKPVVPPQIQPLPQDLTKSKVTLQQPDSKVPLTLPGANALGKQPIAKTEIPPVVFIPQSPDPKNIAPPSSGVRPRKLPSSSADPTVNSPAFSDRPGSLLPNLPDPMERYNSGNSSASVPNVAEPRQQAQPTPVPKASKAPASNPDLANTEDDLDQLPSQMPELFTSGQEKN
jgi:hypothetical protein